MYVNRRIGLKVILKFSWLNLFLFILYGTIVYFLHHNLEHAGKDISIPFQPLSTIGIAVAFYIGFKNNQSYDRFWEGRKIWGQIVNYSRTWGNQVMSFVTLRKTDGSLSEADVNHMHKILIYRHMAWMNALRLQLRAKVAHSKEYRSKHLQRLGEDRPEEIHWKEEVGKFIIKDKEVDMCRRAKNTATQLIRSQGEELKMLMENGMIEDFRHMEMMGTLEQLYVFQGKCERIKNTPLPRQYAHFSSIFTWIFILLLPWGLLGEFSKMGHDLSWLTIPFFVLIAWIFITMEAVGDNSEDPFEGFVNDVPMTALCRTIEIDLRDMLGEDNLPPKIQAKDGVLM
ncbi:MAG: bestrophin family ion channel [Bacteroidota bacterium]